MTPALIGWFSSILALILLGDFMHEADLLAAENIKRHYAKAFTDDVWDWELEE